MPTGLTRGAAVSRVRRVVDEDELEATRGDVGAAVRPQQPARVIDPDVGPDREPDLAHWPLVNA